MYEALITDRRRQPAPYSDAPSPELLLANQIEATRVQLEDARSCLRDARRRVVQLEEALTHWERLATQILARREREGINGRRNGNHPASAR
ncbi:MAG: hypothetical protein FJW88_15080 [Actinobacteria bacterium]|nr:hypothetical protein [Actinomycetota bacterium]